MLTDNSVTTWIARLKSGEDRALELLHRRYWPTLVNVARHKLKNAPLRIADEEDVAQQSFWAFYQSLKAGRFPRLTTRHDLMALFTHIVACRAVNQLEHELGVRKRGAGAVRGDSVLHALAHDDKRSPGFDMLPGKVMRPSDDVLLKDCYQHYMDGLPDHLRNVAELWLAGCTNREIAERLKCVERTIERKLALTRARWAKMAVDSIEGLE
jgi:DNA-directed RNA polymerase specialized sigma24 family protein